MLQPAGGHTLAPYISTLGSFRTLWRTHRTHCSCRALGYEDTAAVLEKFWLARGVSSNKHIAKLISFAASSPLSNEDTDAIAWDAYEPLPSVSAYFQLETSPGCQLLVRAVSTRLIDLHTLLGSRQDINVGQMLICEPRLLTAGLPEIAKRLVIMRGAEGAESIDIAKMVESQPSLLLHDGSSQDSVEAWCFGLASSGEAEWHTKLQQLGEYRQQHGDAHVGFRSADDVELIKFAKMQRAAYRDGTLPQERVAALQELGFVFVADEAEWERWYNELKRGGGDAHPLPLASGDNLLLTNWCSVQRIARRSGVLSTRHYELLSAVNFDWTGADALS